MTLVDIEAEPRALTSWWRSRYGAPLAREFSIVVALLLFYRFGRYLARDQVTSAFDHAHSVLTLERHLGLALEDELQAALLPHRGLIELLNQYYARVHFPATMLFLVLLYVKAPLHYPRIRNLLAAVTAGALALQVVYPLAPPRMLPGFVDTVARFGPAIYERSDVASVANQYAAMPSLHFGWAALVAYGVIQVGRSPWRWAILAHPVATFVAIVATANHYWIDAAVAGLLIAVAVPALRLATHGEPYLPGPVVPLAGGAQATSTSGCCAVHDA